MLRTSPVEELGDRQQTSRMVWMSGCAKVRLEETLMYLERLTLTNFQCFGPEPHSITFDPRLTALLGVNAAGKPPRARLSCGCSA